MAQIQPITDVSQHFLDQAAEPVGKFWPPSLADPTDDTVIPKNQLSPRLMEYALTTKAWHRLAITYFLSQRLVYSALHPSAESAGEMYTIEYVQGLLDSSGGTYGDAIYNFAKTPFGMFYLTYQGSRKSGTITLSDGTTISGFSPDQNKSRETPQLEALDLLMIDPLTGQFTTEAAFDAELDVDQGSRVFTGFGIYGARGQDAVSGQPLFPRHDRSGFWWDAKFRGDLQLVAAAQAENSVASNPRYPLHNLYCLPEFHDFGAITLFAGTAWEFTIPDQTAEITTILGGTIQDALAFGNTNYDNTYYQQVETLMYSRLRAYVDGVVQHPNFCRSLARRMLSHLVERDFTPAHFQAVLKAAEDGVYTLPDGRTIGSGNRGDLLATHAACVLHHQARRDRSNAGSTRGRARAMWPLFVQGLRVLVADSEGSDWADRSWTNSDVFTFGETASGTQFELNCQGHIARSPSVFNFFDEQGVPAGSSFAAAGVDAGELLLWDDNTIIQYTDLWDEILKQSTFTKDGLVDAGSSVYVQFDTTRFMSLAGDPDALVAKFEEELLPYGLEADTRAVAVAAVTGHNFGASPSDADAWTAVRTALFAIVTTNEFIIQR
ncbi:MAG: DUF1800 family protein [Pseudomonadota bacterium]